MPEGIADDAPVDLVFTNFIQDQVLATVNSLQSDYTYTDADVYS